jgi:hypothetical protein
MLQAHYRAVEPKHLQPSEALGLGRIDRALHLYLVERGIDDDGELIARFEHTRGEGPGRLD